MDLLYCKPREETWKQIYYIEIYFSGSLYDQKVKFRSSPLEITYDKCTFSAFFDLFKIPEEINLVNLQQQAFAKLKEYTETTTLSLQYVIDNHKLSHIDVQLMSSIIIVPHNGFYTENCACSVLNLGKFRWN